MENLSKNGNKSFYKKWWFWGIIIVIFIILCILISLHMENRKQERKWEAMAEGFSSYFSDIDNAESQLDKFSYNYEKGEVEYNESKTWLEKYNLITIGMERKNVEEILGKGYENYGIDENESYLSWGEKDGLEKGQVITIRFYNDKVENKTQLGLK